MKLPTIPGYSDRDLESLTPEELSALESDSGDDREGIEALAKDDAAGGAGATEGDDKPAGAGAADDGKGAKVDADGKPLAVADGKPAGEAAAVVVDEPTQVRKAFTADVPADAVAQMDSAKTAKAAAKTADKEALRKLHDGEIDFEEYETIKTKSEADIETANDTISDLKAAISKAEISAAMTQQELAGAYEREVAGLLKQGKAEGLDYKGDAALNKELNGLVRAFGAEATENGLTDDNLEASKWALAQAHSVMRVRHAAKLTKPAAAGAAGAASENQPAAARHGLTTLAHMPNADRALGDTDAVAKFGQLEGDDLERAMATMSKAEIDKLMAAAL